MIVMVVMVMVLLVTVVVRRIAAVMLSDGIDAVAGDGDSDEAGDDIVVVFLCANRGNRHRTE